MTRDEWRRRRIAIEKEFHALPTGRQRAHDLPLPSIYRLVRMGLHASRLWARCVRNFLDVRVDLIEHRIANWPFGLRGLRILQISDLHIDLHPGLIHVICDRVRPIECDLIALTGDFWESSSGNHQPAYAAFRQLLAALPPSPLGIFAVPGNHDSVDSIEWLDRNGFPMLVNSASVLNFHSTDFLLAGVDDAFRFGLHDLQAIERQRPQSLPAILLSHSPQLAAQAAALNYHVMLSGHTHGGQLCMPGGHPPFTMPGIPRAIFSGRWQVGPLTGYTSRGAGASHLPVRLNCPPEITLHVLA